MASAAEATPGEPPGAGSADGDPPVRMSPEAQAELRVRIAHQVASALQDPRRGRGHDATYSSDGSWSSILAYAGLSVGGVGVGGGGAHVEPTPPPIQPGVLPEVLLADFDPYLRRMRGVGAGAGDERANVESDDESVHPPLASSSRRRPAFSSDPEPAPRGRTAESDAAAESDADAVAAAADDPLRLVPPAFFEEAFDLSDPAVFAGVCGDAYAPDATHVSIAARRVLMNNYSYSERDASVRRVSSDGDDAAARLQETLGKHLDVVETRLTRVLSSRSAQFMDAATQINQLVDAVERARVTCAGARRVSKNAASLVSGAFRELDALNRLRSNLGSIESACDVLTKLRDARLDLALFVEAEEHAGALEAAEEVRAIQKNPALVGVACAGAALTRNVAEIERLCGAEIAQQWRDCALLPRGATAQRGGGAPAPEHCFAIVGAAARDAGLSPPPAGEWERVSRRGDSDDDDDSGSVSFFATKDAFWGESRGGLGPDERAFADAATNVYPRLTRALRASCVGEASNASVSAGGVAGDAMRLWADAAAKDVASATRRAARAALVAAGALRGDAFRRLRDDAMSKGEEENLPEALGALPETVLARALEAVAAAAHEHFARAAMCATWARRALGVETTTDSRTGSASSLPRVDSSVSATSASSAASEGTDADAGEAGEAGEAGFDTLETAFGFETFDAAEKLAESDDARAAAVSVACAASEAASSAPPRRRAAIASAASDAARRVADAAQRSFADLLAGFESEPTERPNDARGTGDDVDFFSDARDHLSSVEVCESFARAAETLGRRRCLALRSAVTRRSARWLARFGAAAARKMRDALEAETWAVPEGGETTKKVVASASFLSRAAEAYLLVARRAPALAPDVARRLSELVRAYNARSCRLVLGAEATRGGARLKSVTAAHLAATHGALRLAAAGALRDARRELAPLLAPLPAARRDAWEKEAAKTARDLDAHCAEIRAKLVGIMRERCEARCAEIRACAAIGRAGPERRAGDVAGDVAGAEGGEAHAATGKQTETARAFAETAEAAARELGTIGRVVGEHIDGADADDVLSDIAATFDSGLEAALASVRSEDRSEDRSEVNAALASVARGAAAALARLTSRDESEAAPALTRLGATVAADTEGGPERRRRSSSSSSS